jgi:arginase
MGPSALRLAKLADHLQSIGYTIKDLGNIAVDVPESLEAARGLHYVSSIASSCQRTYDVLRTLPKDVFPLVLGGDHSISMGMVAGVAGRGRTGVLWIDAHADANTPETSPSGNVHGMPLAHLLGHGDPRLLSIWGGQAVVRPEDIVYIGLRSIDSDERAFIRKHKLRAYTMKEIDKLGIARVTEDAIAQLSHLERVHVSFDADALDPSIAPGVGTPVAGGLSYREAHLLMEMLAEAGVVTSLDLVEVNPILDTGNSTATIMVEMAASLLGRTIL